MMPYVTAFSNGSIWNGFSEQHQHQSTRKSIIFNAKLAPIISKKLHILFGTKYKFSLNSTIMMLNLHQINANFTKKSLFTAPMHKCLAGKGELI